MKFLKKNRKNINKDKITDSSATGSSSASSSTSSKSQNGEKASILRNIDGETASAKDLLNPKQQSDLAPVEDTTNTTTMSRVVETDLINKKLPKELIIRIFSYLDTVSLCRCAQVSKVNTVMVFYCCFFKTLILSSKNHHLYLLI